MIGDVFVVVVVVFVFVVVALEGCLSLLFVREVDAVVVVVGMTCCLEPFECLFFFGDDVDFFLDFFRDFDVGVVTWSLCRRERSWEDPRTLFDSSGCCCC